MLVSHKLLKLFINFSKTYIVSLYGSMCLILSLILSGKLEGDSIKMGIDIISAHSSRIFVYAILIEIIITIVLAMESSKNPSKLRNSIYVCLLLTAPVLAGAVVWIKF